MARLYTNENFPLAAAEELRRLGHDVLTVQQAGQAERAASGEAVLAFAHGQLRILVTHNRRHFVRLHATCPDHFGIVVCTVDPDSGALARRVHDAIAAELDMAGKLVKVNRPSVQGER